MKKIECEMCGGNDIVKEGGYFVCQNCGTKYAPEEARKLFTGETVNVAGSVAIDNKAKINDFISLAKSAIDSKTWKEAIEYANKALEADPRCVDALIIKAKAQYFTGAQYSETSASTYLFALDVCENNREEISNIIASDLKDIIPWSNDFYGNKFQNKMARTNDKNAYMRNLKAWDNLIREAKKKYDVDLGFLVLQGQLCRAIKYCAYSYFAHREYMASVPSRGANEDFATNRMDVIDCFDTILDITENISDIEAIQRMLGIMNEDTGSNGRFDDEYNVTVGFSSGTAKGGYEFPFGWISEFIDKKTDLDCKCINKIEKLLSQNHKTFDGSIFVFDTDVSKMSVEEFKDFLLENKEIFKASKETELEAVKSEQFSEVLPECPKLGGYIAAISILIGSGFLFVVILNVFVTINEEKFPGFGFLVFSSVALIIIGLCLLPPALKAKKQKDEYAAILERKNKFENEKGGKIANAQKEFEETIASYEKDPLAFYPLIVDELKNNKKK